MNEREFYRVILGLKEPWQVQAVHVDVGGRKVEVRVGYEEGTLWACPESRERLPVHDHVERTWRHLDTCQFETVLICRVPRLRLPDGRVWTVPVPWAEKGSRFTLLFEQLAVTVLKAARTLTQAAQWLRLDWDAVQRIMERAVGRGLERRSVERVRHVGLDEKSFRRGQSYISVLVDIDAEVPRVLEVAEGRTQADAQLLLEELPERQRAKVEAAAIDMSAAYAGAVRAKLPQAEIVHDRFHVSKLLGEAVDKVRRGEHKDLLAKGDGRLLGTRYLWLWHPDELSGTKLDAFEAVAWQNLRTVRAYYHRLMFLEFWEQPDVPAAQRYFAQWYAEAMRSGLEPIKKVARTLRDHLHGLLSYFRHRITNALCEAFNSSIQALKATARGFRNFEHYRTRILFFLGKLSLNPL
jgi:transposase